MHAALRSLKRRIPPALIGSAARAWRSVEQPWRRFWFEPADATPLAVMRILFGGMLLYTHFVWGLNLEGFFGPSGWQSATLVRTLQADQFAWSFWWWTPHGLFLTVHVLSLFVLALFMLGAFTPVTSVLAYLITISYASRAPMANYGLDQINGLAALYLAIGPSGRVLSIDRFRQRYRAARAQLAAGLEPAIAPVPPSSRANLALRLIQVHLCVIYVFACLSKLQGESWWNGTAIWQAVSNLEYQSRDLTWLAWYPWLVNLLTHATIAWEMTFWALVWKPMLRPFVLAAGAAIHLGIGAFMGMWTFGLAVIFAYVSFLPGEKLAAIVNRGTQWIARGLRGLGIDLASSPSVRKQAAWFALSFEKRDAPPPAEHETPAEAEPTAEPTAAPSLVPASAAENVPIRLVPDETELEIETVAEEPLLVSHRITEPNPKLDESPAPVPRRNALAARPSVLLVEGRLKRQAEVQEYFLKHGFRCHVASELHQARSLLSVIDFDALVVTSSLFSEDDLAAFHEGLVGGGPALPASVFLLGSGPEQADRRLQTTARHRVLAGSLSLRELRILVLEVLGLAEESLRATSGRSRPSKNGQRETTAPDQISEAERPTDIEIVPPQKLDVSAAADGNGSPS